VLRAAESFTGAIFTFSSLDLRQASTYTHVSLAGPDSCQVNNDTLVAEWAVSGPSGAGTLVLEDNPAVSVYTLRVPARAIMSRDDLTAFLAEFLVEKKEPLRLDLAALTFSVPPGPGIAGFIGAVIRSPNAFAWHVDIDGVVREKDAYLAVRVTKDIAEKYYRLPARVPERFPPLAELARDWSFDRVLSEVGRQGCPHERDVVLLTELAKRDLSADQFVDLLVKNAADDSGTLLARAGAVLQALMASDKMTMLEKYMEPALATYARKGGMADEAALHMFRMMGGNCSPGFESQAVKHIEGTYPVGAIWYLERCSASAETLRKLEQLQARGDAVAEVRARAVDAIRRRVAGPPAKKQAERP
jgi:hypothetical protein